MVAPGKGSPQPLALTAPPIAISKSQPEAGNEGRTAILVCHGMGQQVRWASLNDIVETLRRFGFVKVPVSTALVQYVDLPDQPTLGRVSMTLTEGSEQRDVHMYEAYWAPFTEGRVKLKEVINFLFRAGWRGIRYSFTPFNRLLFNKVQVFGRRPELAAFFVLALTTVLGLVVLNVCVAAALASSSWGQESRFGNPAIVSALSQDLLTLEAILGVWVLAIIASAGVRTWRRSRKPEWKLPVFFQQLLWYGFLACLLSISVIGLFVVPTHLVIGRDAAAGAETLKTLQLVVIWGVATLISFVMRWFLIQFGGDVVAYVSGYRVSKFDEIRDAIRRVGLTVGSAIYDLGNYERYVIVGHSLGAVLAYDTLNSLLNRDALRDRRRVLDTTSRLITFGAPLDKTAFVFRSQGNQEVDSRESLASAMQPMICNQKISIQWVNLWSKMDIISGRLDFYGDAVVNRVDPQADVPVLAHTQFWENLALAREIVDACLGRDLHTDPPGL